MASVEASAKSESTQGVEASDEAAETVPVAADKDEVFSEWASRVDAVPIASALRTKGGSPGAGDVRAVEATGEALDIINRSSGNYGIGDTVTIMDTANAREELPEGIGKQYAIQECIGQGVYVVQDVPLLSGDMCLYEKQHRQLPRNMIGIWLHPEFEEPIQIIEDNGTLRVSQTGFPLVPLHQAWPWMIGMPHPGIRYRLAVSSGGNTIVWQWKPSATEKWRKYILLTRVGCIVRGTEMVVYGDGETGLYAKVNGESVKDGSTVTAGTRFIADGPAIPIPSFDLMSLMSTHRVPIHPSNHEIDLGCVRLIEDARDAIAHSSMDDAYEHPTDIVARMSMNSHDIWNALDIKETLLCDGVSLDIRDTVLLHGKWLRNLGSNGEVLARRQDLPPEAIWEPLQLQKLVELHRVHLSAVSYCWLHWEHPDAKGDQIKTLSAALGLRLDDQEFPLDDLAVFMDFGSLYQKHRLPHEHLSFLRGLRNVTLWYTSSKSLVLAMTNPQGTDKPYHVRGWPTFEWSVSSILHTSVTMLDLGKWDGTCTSWAAVSKRCTGTRTPPRSPDMFEQLIQKRIFSNGRTDSERVARMYKQTFLEVASVVLSIEFGSLNWGPAEICVLAGALGFFQQLRQIHLSANLIQPKGAQYLAEGLQHCPQLTDLNLDDCHLRDEGVQALCPVFLQLRCLRLLLLGQNGITPIGAAELFGVLPFCEVIQSVGIHDNPLWSDEVAVVAHEALRAIASQNSRRARGNVIFCLLRCGLNENAKMQMRKLASTLRPNCIFFQIDEE